MPTRAKLIGRTVAGACLASLGASACYEDIRPARALTDDPVVMGISLAVVADGPYAEGIRPMPADRPRAEVLPLDTVELDALVADIDGPVDLGDAAWVLCGDGCLPSLARQGERFGELPACHEGSTAEDFACLAGRGERPQVVIPDLVPETVEPAAFGPRLPLFPRVAVIDGRPEGPTTDECLDQLVVGPRLDLQGCAIGVKDLLYGPPWTLSELLDAAGLNSFPYELPPDLAELLQPNAAAVIEQVRLLPPEALVDPLAEPLAEPVGELRSIHEVIEVEPGTELTIAPEISPRDLQIVLSPVGPNQWLGDPDRFYYDVWSDEPELGGAYALWPSSFPERFTLTIPERAGTRRVYVVATDGRGAVSWFTLSLQVPER